MSMKAIEELRDRLCEELEEYAREFKSRSKDMNMSELDKLHKLSDTVKNFDKIIMLEDGGHSRGDWEARGTYGDDSSYANRGQHYVHGHYSHDGEMSERRRDNRGRYSHDSGKSRMISELHEMMNDATTDKERSAIRRCIEQMEEG